MDGNKPRAGFSAAGFSVGCGCEGTGLLVGRIVERSKSGLFATALEIGGSVVWTMAVGLPELR